MDWLTSDSALLLSPTELCETESPEKADLTIERELWFKDGCEEAAVRKQSKPKINYEKNPIMNKDGKKT